MDVFPLKNRVDRGRLRGMSLQGRFMIAFAAVVVSLIALVILLVGNRQSRSLLAQQQMRGEAVANSIAAVIINPLLGYDYPSLQRAADDAREDTGIAYVIILDKEGLVAGYSGHPEMQGQRLDDIVSRRAAEAQGAFIQQIEAGNHAEIEAAVLDICAPVFVNNSPVQWGTIRVGLSLAAMEAELATTRRDLALLGIFAVIVVLLSARFLTMRLTKPLQELAEATSVIASGDLDHLVDENLLGELGDLARSFNKMTFDLKRSRDAIRYQNQHLENMIQERTAALRQKARELEKANEELKEVDRLKSDFLSNVSHELRTPLTSIRSFTEIMLDPDMDLGPGEQHEFLEIVSSQASRLTRLISDLLDLSRIEAGEFHCRISPIELRQQVVHPVVETLRSLAGDKDVELVNEVGDDLPRVLGDADRLSQVITNLVDNALKFTPPGGSVTVRAKLSEERVRRGENGRLAGMESDSSARGPFLVVEVADTGVGIARPDQMRIFEKFGQVGNVLTEKPQGTGLGLAISGSIMVQHSGALWVESTPGEGSVFCLSMPVSLEAARRDANSGPQALTGIDAGSLVDAVRASGDGRRVLVVDDEAPALDEMVHLLEEAGYRAVGCRGGGQAISQARDLRPDCIVLDLGMPEINGYDVLRLLGGEPATASIPVVALGSGQDPRRALELGARCQVDKVHAKDQGPAPHGVLA